MWFPGIIILQMKNPTKEEVVQELRGFEKIELTSGEKKQVSITIEGYDKESMEIRVGSSSRDIRLRK